MNRRIPNKKASRYQPFTPNAETIEAIKAMRRGEVVTVSSPDKLVESLNEDG